MSVRTFTELRLNPTPPVRIAILALALVALAAVPAAAVILPGSDLFVTQPGYSYQNFTPNPIPGGFFGPGSLPFSGTIQLNGSALGPFGNTDTIVQRNASAAVNVCGDQATVPIEIVALSLVSVNPITVKYSSAPDQTWNVRVTLSSVTMPQPPGTMTIRKTHANGGTFDSQLFVQPKFIFTNTANPLNVVTLDAGAFGMLPIQFTSSGSWMDPAAATGFFFVTTPGGVPLDNDLNPGTPNKIIAPTTANFVAGMRGVGGTCETPMSGYGKRLTEEQQAWARHGALPAQEHAPQPDGREGSTCLPDGTCIITTPSMAALLGGAYHGDNSYCSGDANNDGRDDLCGSLIPGLGPRGAGALALLLLGSGLWIVTRRRSTTGPIA